MSDRDPDEVHCKECGYEVPAATNKIKALRMDVAEAEHGTELAEKDMRVMRAKVARLQGQQDTRGRPERAAAVRVAQYWKDLLAPRTRELKGPRMDRTMDRLRSERGDEGYTEDELKRAIWGYYCRPNVKDGKRVRMTEGGTRYVDLELIMRDAKHVDVGIQIADLEQFHDQALLNEGASHFVATKCACGHARADHAMYRKHLHEACFDCDCNQFDDLPVRADAWLREHGWHDKAASGAGQNGNGNGHAKANGNGRVRRPAGETLPIQASFGNEPDGARV